MASEEDPLTEQGGRAGSVASPASSARRRPKALRLITRLNVGGPARHALLLTRGLRPHFDTVLAAGVPAPDEGELSDPDVDVEYVPLVRDAHPVADARSLHAVRRLLVRDRPLILDTHMAKAGSIGRLAALTVRPRPITIHTFHGHVLRGYFGPRAVQAIVTTERWLARQTDVLVAVSEEVRDEVLALGIGRRDQFEVIPLGFDLTPLLAVEGPSGALRGRIGVPADVPLIGVIGRLVPIKDHAMLLRAFARVDGPPPLVPPHLVILGDGELRTELEGAVRAMGLAARVHFTGWWKDMATALADLDVVALSSQNEGTPVALIEAAAAGKAVVATAVGGVGSVVADGVTGHLVPAGDDGTMARRIEELLADADARQRMGDAGRERVRARYGEERMLADVRTLYESLAARPRR